MRQDGEGTIGRRIAQARREAGLTQEELGQLIGVTTRSIQGYEAGSVIPYRHLRRLEEVTGKPRGWLLYGENGGPGDAGMIATTLAGLVAQIAEDAERIALAAERLERTRAQRRRPRAGGGPA